MHQVKEEVQIRKDHLYGLEMMGFAVLVAEDFGDSTVPVDVRKPDTNELNRSWADRGVVGLGVSAAGGFRRWRE